jgi:Flp pilus assembly protein CpaB
VTVAAVVLRVILSPYGPPVVVLVATRDLALGTAVIASDVVEQRWPRSLVPPGPLTDVTALEGLRLTARITAGTVLTAGHLRDDDPLARIGAGRAAVAVPTELLPGITTDTRVDLVGVAGDGSGRTLAPEGRVLAVEADLVWLEVERERAADVAAAALRGTLSGVVLAP